MVGADLHRWAAAIEADVRAGASLVSLLEDVAEDLAGAFSLCPECTVRPVRPGTVGAPHGMCATCWLRRLAERQRETLEQINVQREYNVGKTAVKRGRIAAGIPLPRGLKPRDAYPQVNVVSTDMPIGTLIHTCQSCGFEWPSKREVDDVCPECQERQERRAAARAAYR